MHTSVVWIPALGTVLSGLASQQSPSTRSSDSEPSTPSKSPFASLLDDAETEKENDAKARPRANKSTTPEALAVQVPLHIDLQTDDRGWKLSLPKDKSERIGRDAKAVEDATADDETAKPKATATPHQGEVAFAVNFIKASPANVPATHGSATHSATPIASAAPAQSGASQMGSQGGSSQQGKQGNHEQARSDLGAQANAATTPVTHPDTSAQTQASAASTTAIASNLTNVNAMPSAAGAYTGAQPAVKTVSVQSAEPVAPVSEPEDTVSPRPQSIDLQVAGADDREVNVRVSQRSGDVQVTVRTADTDLAQSLRQHLPELSDRLAQSGVQSDIWHPSAAAGSSSSDTETNSSPQDDGQAYGGGAGENAAGQRQGNEEQQDAWLTDLFSSEKGE